MFQGLKSVVQGADHIERSKICQDAAAFKAGEHYGVAACADGHGGAKYIRSEVGSRIAVECAIEVVDAYMEDYERFSREIRKNSSYILGHMAEKFMAAWTEKIEDYNDANPLSDAEREALAKARGDENNFYSFYGSTVLAAVAAEDFQYGFLVGDGGFAVVSQDGSVTIPIEDPNSHANYTSSLCSRDAISSFVSYYLEEKPLAMCVSTDGLIKSFDTEKDFLDYHVLLATMLQNPERCQVSLEKNLMKRTHSGSGDDISVAVIFDPELLAGKREMLLDQIHQNQEEKRIREEAALSERRRRAEELERARKAEEERQRRLEMEELEEEKWKAQRMIEEIDSSVARMSQDRADWKRRLLYLEARQAEKSQERKEISFGEGGGDGARGTEKIFDQDQDLEMTLPKENAGGITLQDLRESDGSPIDSGSADPILPPDEGDAEGEPEGRMEEDFRTDPGRDPGTAPESWKIGETSPAGRMDGAAPDAEAPDPAFFETGVPRDGD